MKLGSRQEERSVQTEGIGLKSVDVSQSEEAMLTGNGLAHPSWSHLGCHRIRTSSFRSGW